MCIEAGNGCVLLSVVDEARVFVLTPQPWTWSDDMPRLPLLHAQRVHGDAIADLPAQEDRGLLENQMRRHFVRKWTVLREAFLCDSELKAEYGGRSAVGYAGDSVEEECTAVGYSAVGYAGDSVEEECEEAVGSRRSAGDSVEEECTVNGGRERQGAIGWAADGSLVVQGGGTRDRALIFIGSGSYQPFPKGSRVQAEEKKAVQVDADGILDMHFGHESHCDGSKSALHPLESASKDGSARPGSCEEVRARAGLWTQLDAIRGGPSVVYYHPTLILHCILMGQLADAAGRLKGLLDELQGRRADGYGVGFGVWGNSEARVGRDVTQTAQGNGTCNVSASTKQNDPGDSVRQTPEVAMEGEKWVGGACEGMVAEEARIPVVEQLAGIDLSAVKKILCIKVPHHYLTSHATCVPSAETKDARTVVVSSRACVPWNMTRTCVSMYRLQMRPR
jgi:hypothetical protein